MHMREDRPPAPDGPPLLPAAEARLVLTTAPPDVARDLAHTLVAEGLAACVSLVPGLRSVYRWRGAVHDDPETQLVAKTSTAGVERLAARLLALHPYEVPEVLVLTPEAGSPAWLAWLEAQILGDSGEK